MTLSVNSTSRECHHSSFPVSEDLIDPISEVFDIGEGSSSKDLCGYGIDLFQIDQLDRCVNRFFEDRIELLTTYRELKDGIPSYEEESSIAEFAVKHCKALQAIKKYILEALHNLSLDELDTLIIHTEAAFELHFLQVVKAEKLVIGERQEVDKQELYCHSLVELGLLQDAVDLSIKFIHDEDEGEKFARLLSDKCNTPEDFHLLDGVVERFRITRRGMYLFGGRMSIYNSTPPADLLLPVLTRVLENGYVEFVMQQLSEKNFVCYDIHEKLSEWAGLIGKEILTDSFIEKYSGVISLGAFSSQLILYHISRNSERELIEFLLAKPGFTQRDFLITRLIGLYLEEKRYEDIHAIRCLVDSEESGNEELKETLSPFFDQAEAEQLFLNGCHSEALGLIKSIIKKIVEEEDGTIEEKVAEKCESLKDDENLEEKLNKFREDMVTRFRDSKAWKLRNRALETLRKFAIQSVNLPEVFEPVIEMIGELENDTIPSLVPKGLLGESYQRLKFYRKLAEILYADGQLESAKCFVEKWLEEYSSDGCTINGAFCRFLDFLEKGRDDFSGYLEELTEKFTLNLPGCVRSAPEFLRVLLQFDQLKYLTSVDKSGISSHVPSLGRSDHIYLKFNDKKAEVRIDLLVFALVDLANKDRADVAVDLAHKASDPTIKYKILLGIALGKVKGEQYDEAIQWVQDRCPALKPKVVWGYILHHFIKVKEYDSAVAFSKRCPDKKFRKFLFEYITAKRIANLSKNHFDDAIEQLNDADLSDYYKNKCLSYIGRKQWKMKHYDHFLQTLDLCHHQAFKYDILNETWRNENISEGNIQLALEMYEHCGWPYTSEESVKSNIKNSKFWMPKTLEVLMEPIKKSNYQKAADFAKFLAYIPQIPNAISSLMNESYLDGYCDRYFIEADGEK